VPGAILSKVTPERGAGRLERATYVQTPPVPRRRGGRNDAGMKQASKSFNHLSSDPLTSKGLERHSEDKALKMDKGRVGGSMQGSPEDGRWRVMSESRAESRAESRTGSSTFMALLTSDSMNSMVSSIEHELHSASSRSEEDEGAPQLLMSPSMSDTGEGSEFSSFRTTSSSSSSSSLPSLDTSLKDETSHSSDADSLSRKSSQASSAAKAPQEDTKADVLSHHSELTRPSHWSDRQLQLAMQGPLDFRGASVLELMWFGLIWVRSLVILWLIYAR